MKEKKDNNLNKILTARVAGKDYKEMDFKQVKCIFLVSIGKENFEGDALTAQLVLFKQKFADITILAADSLQRFNFLSLAKCKGQTVSVIEAEEKSIVQGEIWRKSYSSQLEPFAQTDWNDWKNIQGFEQAREEIESRLEKDPNYLSALQQSIEEYKKRFLKHNNLTEITEELECLITNNCKKYLIEECSIFKLIAQKGYNYIVYPGKATPIIEASLNWLQYNSPKHTLEWLTLRLEKKSHSNETGMKFFSRSLGLSEKLDNLKRELKIIGESFSSKTEKEAFVDELNRFISLYKASDQQSLVL